MAGDASRSRLGDLRGRALWVVLACLVCQMGLGFGYVFGPLAPDLLEELGWTRTMYSSARAPQLFVIALASPLIGTWVVRHGARRVLTSSVLLLGATAWLLSGLQSLWQMYAAVVLYGLAVTGLGDITVGQVVSNWISRNRGLALGIVYTGSNLGGAVFTRLAAFVADRETWREAFATLGVGALVVMLPFALWGVRDKAPRTDPNSSSGDTAAVRVGEESDMNLKRALRTRSFWILAGSLFSFFAYFIAMIEHFVLFLTDEGLPRDEATAHFSNAILLGMVSKILIGLLADRIPHRSAILLDYALLAGSSVLLLFLPDPRLLPVFVVAYGFSVAARDVVYPLIVTDCFGVRYMAQIYGALMLALLPGGVLGPIFASAIHDHFGSYEFAFATFAAMNLAAVAALVFLKKERAENRRSAPSGAPELR